MLNEEQLIRRLAPPSGKVRMVLDTDTFNEVDDQFALTYALLSPEAMEVEAVYAAPYHHDGCSGPEDGMERSYTEILKVMGMLNTPHPPVFRGSTTFLTGRDEPERSAAVQDLIERAMQDGDGPLYVAAIGAITNVASALQLEPRIAERIVVVWLAGRPHHAANASDFNLRQDMAASQWMFDCGVPLVQVPCLGVASHLLTTVTELEQNVAGHGDIGDYLYSIVRDYGEQPIGWSKVIWDISAIAYLINPAWILTDLVHSPILTDRITWSLDEKRHFMRVATYADRDPIYGDLFEKLRRHAM